MGGCASKPKEFDTPVEAPISPEKPQLETTAQDNTNGGENQIEKPLVDLSESEAAAAEPVSSQTVVEAAKPTEDDEVKAAAKNDEDKVEVTDNTKVEPVKEAEVAQETNATPSKEEVKSNN